MVFNDEALSGDNCSVFMCREWLCAMPNTGGDRPLKLVGLALTLAALAHLCDSTALRPAGLGDRLKPLPGFVNEAPLVTGD